MYRSRAIHLVREALREADMKQKDLAKAAGLSDPTVSRVIRGDLVMSKASAEGLADALGLCKEKLVRYALWDKIWQLIQEYEDYPTIQEELISMFDGRLRDPHSLPLLRILDSTSDNGG